MMDMHLIKSEIENFKEQVGYYPTSAEWNSYALSAGIITSVEIQNLFNAAWFDIIPEAEIERSRRKYEHSMKTPLVVETEINLLQYIEKHGSFPGITQWNLHALKTGFMTVRELQMDAMTWWDRWSLRYGGSSLKQVIPQSSESLDEFKQSSDSLNESERSSEYSDVSGQSSESLDESQQRNKSSDVSGQIFADVSEEDHRIETRLNVQSKPEFKSQTDPLSIEAKRLRDKLSTECIDALQAAATELGDSFLQKDYNTYARANGLPIFIKFVSLFRHSPRQWDAAMLAAGLTAEKVGRRLVKPD